MKADYHVHTNFSKDSDTCAEEQVREAIFKGIQTICITDHHDLDFTEPNFEIDFENYFSILQGLKEKYLRQIDILIGMEFGLQKHLSKQFTELVQKYPFDFVIGSSHVVHGFDPYYPDFFANRSVKSSYRVYFESILENIQAFDGFDVYGHLDYIVRYGPTQNTFYTYSQFSDVIDEILRLLIKKGKGIEINTGGFKYGLGHPNPTEDIIRRYRELGGEIITIGADAHTPAHIAYDFGKVPAILKEAGFDYFTIFKNRKPEFIKL